MYRTLQPVRWQESIERRDRMILVKTGVDKMPSSCVECKYGERYGCVGDMKCQVLNEYFTNNTKPPYNERSDECPLVDTEPIIQRMEEFETEYRSYSENSVDHFGGKADAMDTAKRLVKAALNS